MVHENQKEKEKKREREQERATELWYYIEKSI